MSLYYFTGRYTTMQATLLTSGLQLLSYKFRQSQLRFLLSPLLFRSFFSLFLLAAPAKQSLHQGWESTHSLHLYRLGGVFYSPNIEHQLWGTSILVSSEARWRALKTIHWIDQDHQTTWQVFCFGTGNSTRAIHSSNGPTGPPPDLS